MVIVKNDLTVSPGSPGLFIYLYRNSFYGVVLCDGHYEAKLFFHFLIQVYQAIGR
jgi:hypothetical protein